MVRREQNILFTIEFLSLLAFADKDWSVFSRVPIPPLQKCDYIFHFASFHYFEIDNLTFQDFFVKVPKFFSHKRNIDSP